MGTQQTYRRNATMPNMALKRDGRYRARPLALR